MSERHRKILDYFGTCYGNEFTLAEWAELIEMWNLRIGPNGLDKIYDRWCNTNRIRPIT